VGAEKQEFPEISPIGPSSVNPYEKNAESLYGLEYLKRPMSPPTVNRWEDNGIFYGTAVTTNLLAKKLEAKKILDVGCGRGWVVRHLRNLKFETDGMEYSKDAVKFSMCDAKWGDLTERIPYDDKSYDLIISLGVLSHLPADRLIHAVRELARVSRRYIWTNIQVQWHRLQQHHKNFLPHEIWRLIFKEAGCREMEELRPFLKERNVGAPPLTHSAVWEKT